MESKVLAVVNGREITEADLNYAISKLPQERRSYLTTEQGKRQFLEQMIAWELMYNHALEVGFEKREDYLYQLEDAKKAILTQMVMQDVLSGIQISQKEIEDYYNVYRDKFVEGEQVSARHILVDSLEKANEVIEIINNGMTFEEAAQLFSSCPSKAQGGSLGYFGRGMMVPEFENAVFELEKGVISQPVKTQFGYHIILVEDKKEAATKPLEEVAANISRILAQEKQNQIYINFINQLMKKYPVEIK